MSTYDTDVETLQSGIYPTLSLRDLVLFPGTVSPLFIGRDQSVAAIEEACKHPEQRLFMTAQKDPDLEAPGLNDLHTVGCVGVLLQVLRLQDGTIKVLVEAEARAKVKSMVSESPHLSLDIELLHDFPYDNDDCESEASKHALVTLYNELMEKNKQYPKELKGAVSSDMTLSQVTHLIAAHLKLSQEQKYFLLMEQDVLARADILLTEIKEMLNQIEIDQKIQQKVKQRMDDSQLKYYLNEKLNVVQNEINDVEGEPTGDDLSELEEQIESAGLSQEAFEKAQSELNKLRMMAPLSSEATVIRHYLDTLLEMPWKKSSKLNKDIIKAQKVLDQDHYGIEKVKERIVEYLAVEKRAKQSHGPILCLVGPPGVGKTSLGESIAKATGREFVKLSLGGVRDEAEIRGHRKTYIGAMPGRIMQKLAKCKKNNPVFLLDEIDKLGSDFRGDPASALLEVLDPSQNKQFNDHYLEVDFDLSKVMFIATANSLDIPYALLDRLELIHLSGYTETENDYLFSLDYKKLSSMLAFDCTKSAAGLSAHEKLAYNLACTQEEVLASEITNYALLSQNFCQNDFDANSYEHLDEKKAQTFEQCIDESERWHSYQSMQNNDRFIYMYEDNRTIIKDLLNRLDSRQLDHYGKLSILNVRRCCSNVGGSVISNTASLGPYDFVQEPTTYSRSSIQDKAILQDLHKRYIEIPQAERDAEIDYDMCYQTCIEKNTTYNGDEKCELKECSTLKSKWKGQEAAREKRLEKEENNIANNSEMKVEKSVLYGYLSDMCMIHKN